MPRPKSSRRVGRSVAPVEEVVFVKVADPAPVAPEVEAVEDAIAAEETAAASEETEVRDGRQTQLRFRLRDSRTRNMFSRFPEILRAIRRRMSRLFQRE